MQQQELNYEDINNEADFDGELPYTFSPSISVRKNVDGKTYYVRRFFKGGKDFEKTMQSLAVKQIYKNMR